MTGLSVSDEQLAVLLMAAEEEEPVWPWAEKWMPLFPEWLKQEHQGDCTKASFSCARCQAEEYLTKARVFRRLYESGAVQ